jgi:transcriptional regulator with XRE-family HTH domain
MSNVSQIDGSVVRLRREAQGWAINDIASRACLSVKQIRQIEEGGLSSFYSENVKLTAAKKVAALLQLSEAQLFGQVPLYPPQAEEESFLFDSATEPFQCGFAT